MLNLENLDHCTIIALATKTLLLTFRAVNTVLYQLYVYGNIYFKCFLASKMHA